MNHSMINAAVSIQALQQKLDLVSNNIANTDTIGYKRKEASFQDVLTSLRQQPQGFAREGRMTPLGYNYGWGAKLVQAELNMAQGSLEETQNPLDIAIHGKGLFEVAVVTLNENNEPVQQIRWTRDGAFKLGVDPEDPESMYLVTKDGHFVLNDGSEPIRVPANHRIQVREDGMITAYDDADETAEPIEVGQLKLVRAVRPQLLEQLGDNLYTLPADITPEIRETILQTVNEDNNAIDPITVQQGYLEQSNVVLADELTELSMVQRAYQLNSRALASADQMLGLANSLRG